MEITELPVQKWTKDFKIDLEKMIENGEIEDFTEHHPMNRIHFRITFPHNKMRDWANKSETYIETKFKLTKTVAFSNMVLYAPDGKLYKYDNEVDIMKEFYTQRKDLYEQRKVYMLKKLHRDFQRLSNKARFVVEVVEERLRILKVKKKDLVKDLKAKGFETQTEIDAILADYEKKPPAAVANAEGDEEEQDAEAAQDDSELPQKEYDYLLSMPVMSLTFELVEKILKQKAEKKAEYDALEKKTIQMIWEEDIEAFLAALDEYEAWEEDERLAATEESGGNKRKRRPKRVAAKEPNSGRKKPQKKEPNSARSN